VADLLIGQDGTAAPEKMTALHLSAFKELIQQTNEVLSRQAKKLKGAKATWQVTETSTKDSSAGSSYLNQLGKSLAVIQFSFSIQDLLSGDLLFCLPDPVAVRLASGGGKPAESTGPSADTTAEDVQSGVSSENTQKRAGGATVPELENEFSGSARPTGGNIGLLMDVPLKLTVELGRTTKLVKEILALAPGSVVELDKLAGEAVDILVNEKLIAKGEVVVIDENFGVRITEIINPEERLTAVQA
jgi:flagellar motor switch protein FliN/FliY